MTTADPSADTDVMSPARHAVSPGTVLVPPIPLEGSTYPGHGHDVWTEDGMRIERDIEITLSDGTRIYSDLFLPDGVDEPLPVLIGWSPYGKHNGIDLAYLPGHEIDPANITKHYRLEAAEPTYWCSHGYAMLFPDPRGTWASEGQHSLFSTAEARDFYEVIEWAAAQPWCTGKVGLIGQSYFAVTQWKVAALRPPHLTCIAPWGAASDIARTLLHHGGIPETVFFQNFMLLAGVSAHSLVENLGEDTLAHPFHDAFWDDKTQRLADIDVPAYVVADWTDAQVHNPGTMDGWAGISSTRKWLEINGRSKWARFVEPEHADRLRMFYDTFLQGKDHGIDQWPAVRLEVREGSMQGHLRDEAEWPLARTDYRPLYLAPDGSASFTPATASGTVEYDALTGHASFDFPVTEDLEITGFAKLRLWVEADGSDDMDLFVAMRRIDADGNTVHFPLDTIHRNGEAALGWLRVSHRHQDPQRSTAFRPVLTHDREERLAPGQIVPVDIELRPSSTLFRAGDTLQVVVQVDDFAVNNRELPGVIGHTSLRNAGRHILHLGGNHDSHLLLPVIP